MTVEQGNVSLHDMTAAGNARVAVRNGNINMHDASAAGDVALVSTGHGSINANNAVSGGTTRVELNSGDLFLNLAEGKAVLLRMENNTAASRVNRVSAEAAGGTAPDVVMTGNFIHIGSLAAKAGDSVFQLEAMGAGNQRLISGDFSVESLSSRHGTRMPRLWSNRGYVHVDEGDLAMADVLAVDKIHLENEQTDLAIYGRTPTRDGEQLVYWNNLDMAYGKERGFQLYTNGRLRTSRAVLIDADRNYGKLYGDNLSVVDMMRERLTGRHGRYTFDSTLLTEPGRAMRQPVFFGMEAADGAIRQQNAAAEEIVVE